MPMTRREDARRTLGRALAAWLLAAAGDWGEALARLHEARMRYDGLDCPLAADQIRRHIAQIGDYYDILPLPPGVVWK